MLSSECQGLMDPKNQKPDFQYKEGTDKTIDGLNNPKIIPCPCAGMKCPCGCGQKYGGTCLRTQPCENCEKDFQQNH